VSLCAEPSWGTDATEKQFGKVAVLFQSLRFPPRFDYAVAGTGRMGKWGSATTYQEVEEAGGAHGLCQ